MADEEACEKKIRKYVIFFRPLHVYKKRTKLKTYYLQDRDVCGTTWPILCSMGS